MNQDIVKRCAELFVKRGSSVINCGTVSIHEEIIRKVVCEMIVCEGRHEMYDEDTFVGCPMAKYDVYYNLELDTEVRFSWGKRLEIEIGGLTRVFEMLHDNSVIAQQSNWIGPVYNIDTETWESLISWEKR